MYNHPTVPDNWYTQHSNDGQYPPPPPARPTPAHRRLWHWYRRKSKGAQAGLGCIGGIILLTFCGLCSTLASFSQVGQMATAPTPTAQTTLISTGQTNPTTAPTRESTATPLPAPTTKPTARPTARPAPRPTPQPTCQGVNGNPWCYDFSPGNVISHPPATFCQYFSCISSFWSGQGYVMECQDTMYSKSGGRSGSCSHHGGNWRPLYSH